MLHAQFHESLFFLFVFLCLSRDPFILRTLPASKSPTIERCSFRKCQLKYAMFEESHWLQLLYASWYRVRRTDVTEKIFAYELTVYQLTVTLMFHRMSVILEVRKWPVSRPGHLTAEDVTRCIGEGVNGRITLRWIFRKWDVRVWTGSSWLRIETVGRHL